MNNLPPHTNSTAEAVFYLKAAMLLLLLGLLGFVAYTVAYHKHLNQQTAGADATATNKAIAAHSDPKQAGLKHTLANLVTPFAQLVLDGNSATFIEIHSNEFIALDKAKKLKGSYALEVMRAFDERTIVAFLDLVDNPSKYKYFRYEPGKKQDEFFVLLYGEYANKTAADQALASQSNTAIKYRQQGYRPKVVLIDDYLPYISNRSGDADMLDLGHKKVRAVVLSKVYEKPYVPSASGMAANALNPATAGSATNPNLLALQGIDAAFEHAVTPADVTSQRAEPTDTPSGRIDGPSGKAVPPEAYRQ